MKMKFIYSIAAGLLFLTSCGGSGWPDETKKQMLDGCKVSGSEAACECYIEKITSKYSPEDIAGNEDAMKDVTKILQDCISESAE